MLLPVPGTRENFNKFYNFPDNGACTRGEFDAAEMRIFSVRSHDYESAVTAFKAVLIARIHAC